MVESARFGHLFSSTVTGSGFSGQQSSTERLADYILRSDGRFLSSTVPSVLTGNGSPVFAVFLSDNDTTVVRTSGCGYSREILLAPATPADYDARELRVLVWSTVALSHPFSHTNWSENAETFGIAGAAWILADLLLASVGTFRDHWAFDLKRVFERSDELLELWVGMEILEIVVGHHPTPRVLEIGTSFGTGSTVVATTSPLSTAYFLPLEFCADLF